MFLRRVGNKVLLLHSVRDGEGRVQQRRLGQFDTLEQLRSALAGTGWEDWRQDVQATYPGVSARWDDLLVKARELADRGSATPRIVSSAPRRGGSRAEAGERPVVRAQGDEQRAGELIRGLTRCISRLEDEDVRERLAAQLEDLRDECLQRRPEGLREAEELVAEGELERAREVLQRALRRTERETDGRRRCFAPGDADGEVRLRALELLADLSGRVGEGEAAARLWQQRVRSSPDGEAVSRYGACLQRLERWDEAVQQYRRLPKKDPRRHFHLAAVHWQSGDAETAIEELLRGLVLDRNVGEDLALLQKGRAAAGYWRRHGHLWSASGRCFFEKVFREPAVRWTLRRAAEKQRRPRQLLPARTVAVVLEKALTA